jgi:AAHS family 4-hydroxybenzoate transporter-like MFS transporter
MSASRSSSLDPRSILLDSPMSVFQWAAIAITFALSALDGFDVLAVTLAAPSLVREWHVNPASLGLVFSVGLVGMAAGSFLVAPVADVIGRRSMALVTLALMSGGMLMSARAGDVGSLALWRFVNGVGIGATVAIINPLAAEYANLKQRDFAISMMAIGFPMGGVFGGASAAYLLATDGWRAIFLFGGGIGIVLMLLVLFLLPEPIAFIIAKQRPNALEQVNRFLRRCGHQTVEALPPAPAEKPKARPFEIFGPGNIGATVHVAAILFLYVLTVYFLLNWMPQMVASAGFTPAAAAKVSVMLNVSGSITAALFGWASGRFGLKKLALASLVGLGLATAAFGFSPPDLAILTLGAVVAGAFVHPGMVAMHSLIARTFPPHMRATGAGFALGMGRIGSAVAPATAGYLFNAGMSRGGVSVVLGASSILAAGLLLFFHVRNIGVGERPDAPADAALAAA